MFDFFLKKKKFDFHITGPYLFIYFYTREIKCGTIGHFIPI